MQVLCGREGNRYSERDRSMPQRAGESVCIEGISKSRVEREGGEMMEIQVKQSKKTKLCIVYHPNPTEIQSVIDEIMKILKNVE